MSGIRIRNEIFKILEENHPIDTLLECENFKLFKHLNIDLICLSGGNDIKDKTTKSIIRKKLDNYYYKKAKLKGIPVIGICHGAQFIAQKEGGKIEYKKQYIKKIIWINGRYLEL